MDIKLQKKWKYSDTMCSGCSENEESREEILLCASFGETSEKIPFSYGWFYSGKVENQILVARILVKKLKMRQKIIEEIT